MSTTKNRTDRKNSTRKIIRFPDSLLVQIQKADSDGNFSKWVVAACEEKLRSGSVR